MVATHLTTEELFQQVIDRYWETIPRVSNSVRVHIHRIVSENFEISAEQFHILRHIRKGNSSVSELAAIRQISRSAISQAVDLLVEKGLIARRENVEDRRYVDLELTTAGDELLNAMIKKNRAWMMERLATLDSEEISSVMRGLELLKKAFGEPLE